MQKKEPFTFGIVDLGKSLVKVDEYAQRLNGYDITILIQNILECMSDAIKHEGHVSKVIE